MKKDLLAADRYAQALFELTQAEGQDEYAEAALESFSAGLAADPSIERFLANPVLTVSQKRGILERAFAGKNPSIDATLTKFFLLLFQKNRFYLVHDVAQRFRKIADESQGQGVVEIRSAVSLSDTQRAAIVARLERISGKKMQVRATVDPTLLGGAVVKVGNKVIDDSAQTKIGNFKKELTNNYSSLRGA